MTTRYTVLAQLRASADPAMRALAGRLADVKADWSAEVLRDLLVSLKTLRAFDEDTRERNEHRLSGFRLRYP